MRDPRRNHRLALAVAAATLAGVLTALAEPRPIDGGAIGQQIALLSGKARAIVSPTPLQPPQARTIVSKTQ